MDTSEWPHIINNYYMRPSAKRPYYYISNIEDPVASATGSPARKVRGTRYGNATVPVM